MAKTANCPVCKISLDPRGLRAHLGTHKKNVQRIREKVEPIMEYKQGYRDGWLDSKKAA